MSEHRLVLASLILALNLAPADASVRNFFAPEVEGARLDACLSSGLECGKPAADAFCRAQGFSNAIIFQREPANLTRSLDGGQACESDNCTSFRQIKCFSSSAGSTSTLN